MENLKKEIVTLKEDEVFIVLSHNDAFEILAALSFSKKKYKESYKEEVEAVRQNIAGQMADQMDKDSIMMTKLLTDAKHQIKP